MSYQQEPAEGRHRHLLLFSCANFGAGDIDRIADAYLLDPTADYFCSCARAEASKKADPAHVIIIIICMPCRTIALSMSHTGTFIIIIQGLYTPDSTVLYLIYN